MDCGAQRRSERLFRALDSLGLRYLRQPTEFKVVLVFVRSVRARTLVQTNAGDFAVCYVAARSVAFATPALRADDGR